MNAPDETRRSCPGCGRAILRQAREGDGAVFLGRGIKFRADGNATTKCPEPTCRTPLLLVRAGAAPLTVQRLLSPAESVEEEPTVAQ